MLRHRGMRYHAGGIYLPDPRVSKRCEGEFPPTGNFWPPSNAKNWGLRLGKLSVLYIIKNLIPPSHFDNLRPHHNLAIAGYPPLHLSPLPQRRTVAFVSCICNSVPPIS